MSDVKVFRIRPAVTQIELKAVRLERDIQHLIEANMETFFGVRFLKTEYVIKQTEDEDYEAQGGRIDSLGIDENNCPIVLEYKRDTNENVINQGLFYLDWLLNHKADFKLLVMEKLGRDVAEAVDWSSPAVYCVANSFGKYDMHAIRQMNRNIRLVRYAIGEDTILFEFLNAPSVAPAPVQDVETNGHPTDKTFTEQLASTSEELRETVGEIRQYMSSLGDDVSENQLKLYLAIKKVRNIVCVEVQKKKIILHLALDGSTVEENNHVKNVTGKGHWGTGDVEVTLSSRDDLEAVKPLLDRSYNEN